VLRLAQHVQMNEPARALLLYADAGKAHRQRVSQYVVRPMA
jgi:hypothetical protein